MLFPGLLFLIRIRISLGNTAVPVITPARDTTNSCDPETNTQYVEQYDLLYEYRSTEYRKEYSYKKHGVLYTRYRVSVFRTKCFVHKIRAEVQAGTYYMYHEIIFLVCSECQYSVVCFNRLAFRL